MVNKIPLPSTNLLLATDYQEFQTLASEYLAPLDAASIIASLTLDDLRSMSMHPAGFLVLYIIDPKQREHGQLRLHIWPVDIDPSKSDIHYHTWHLASKVLLGVYQESLPVVRIVDKEDSQYGAYQISHCKDDIGGLQVVPDRHAHMQDGLVKKYDVNDIHYLPAGEYHLTKPRGLTITLNVMGKTLLDYSEFVRSSRSNIRPDEQSRQLTIDVEKVYEQLVLARTSE